MKAKDHPTVRRASTWWATRAIGAVGPAVFFTFLAIRDPTNETLIWAAAASVIFAIVMGFFVLRQIKQLRFEFRYKNEDNDEWDQRFEAELLKLGMTPDAAAMAIGVAAESGDNFGDPKEVARRYAAANPDKE